VSDLVNALCECSSEVLRVSDLVKSALCECSSEVLFASVLVESGLETEITTVGDPPH
jgi:hypothetical protein